MAIWRPLFASVNGPNRFAASPDNVKLTLNWPGLLVLRFSVALRKSRPVTTGALLRRYQLSPVSGVPEAVRRSELPGTNSVLGGRTPPCLASASDSEVYDSRDSTSFHCSCR